MQPTQTPAVDTATQPAPSDPTPVTTVARILRDAGRYLFRHGWTQGTYYEGTGGSFQPPACLVGAIGMVCYGGPVDAPALNDTDPGFADFEAALGYLDAFVSRSCPSGQYADGCACAYEFNDAKGRTVGEVLHLLTEAADAWDKANVGHADYPHWPGTLHDCPVCERECFCADGFQCVHCAEDAEHSGGRSLMDGAE